MVRRMAEQEKRERMWQWIEFTPEEEDALDEARQLAYRETHPDAKIEDVAGGLPTKKASRHSAPKAPRKQHRSRVETPQPPQEP